MLSKVKYCILILFTCLSIFKPAQAIVTTSSTLLTLGAIFKQIAVFTGGGATGGAFAETVAKGDKEEVLSTIKNGAIVGVAFGVSAEIFLGAAAISQVPTIAVFAASAILVTGLRYFEQPHMEYAQTLAKR